ncbi:MAG: response regulator [Methylobacter sp.]|nr:MAG: response regulator [Methylobacter sp.]
MDRAKILVVDDTPASLKLLSDILKAEGYKVRAAINGELALHSAIINPPKLVLLDICMPEMDGFEVCRRLKAQPETRDIPVIFVSAVADTNEKVQGFELGAVDFVTKPYQREELLARVHTHLEVDRLRNDLKDLYEDLKRVQAQLLQQDKMASIGQLAAGVAHEINNPVGFVSSNLGVMRRYIDNLFKLLDVYDASEDNLPEQTRAAITGLKQAIDLAFLRADMPNLLTESMDGLQRIKHIVQNLKDFSHVSESDKQWANLELGLDSALNMAQNEFKYKVDVIKEYAGIPEIECLPSQLNQVFMNLLINADQAIKDHGEIRIATRSDADSVQIAISDTGCGIPPENLKRIFDPFFTTKDVGKGTGLGLAITYDIVVNKHGGRIDVKSEVGVGTTFTIVLPIKREQKPQDAQTGSVAKFS